MRFSRFTTIFRTLHRYGLDEFFVNHSRLRVIHLFLRWLPLPRDVSEPLPRRVRLALESLGPIFVKFGQVLSTRRDLLPPAIAEELARLQDRVPPFPTEEALAQLHEAYGKPVDEVFARFDREPVASASIAQVHFAELPDGTEVAVKVLRPYIDWTPFFLSWELAGKFPRILEDEVVGEEATRLYADANAMLDQLEKDQSVRCAGIVGLFPANAVGDSIEVYTDETRTQVRKVLHHLRQQSEKQGFPNYCLADYVAPKESGKPDWIGAFAVTGGIGEEAIAKAYKADHDDYNAILIQAVCDRLAEAFAEYLHEQVRKVHWGYAPDEALSNEELIRENYQGIRPAPGYPACPEHTEKGSIWELLDVEQAIGMQLTESYAMWPGAAVSGWYFSHPESKYFAVAQIQQDQVEDYAQRKGMTLAEAERWLGPNLH